MFLFVGTCVKSVLFCLKVIILLPTSADFLSFILLCSFMFICNIASDSEHSLGARGKHSFASNSEQITNEPCLKIFKHEKPSIFTLISPPNKTSTNLKQTTVKINFQNTCINLDLLLVTIKRCKNRICLMTRKSKDLAYATCFTQMNPQPMLFFFFFIVSKCLE